MPRSIIGADLALRRRSVCPAVAGLERLGQVSGAESDFFGHQRARVGKQRRSDVLAPRVRQTSGRVGRARVRSPASRRCALRSQRQRATSRRRSGRECGPADRQPLRRHRSRCRFQPISRIPSTPIPRPAKVSRFAVGVWAVQAAPGICLIRRLEKAREPSGFWRSMRSARAAFLCLISAVSMGSEM